MTIINKPTIIPADRWNAIFKTGKPDPTPEPEVHYKEEPLEEKNEQKQS